jgi:glutathione synthase/RimK-type ligase-like ATP-grasp enzyme
MSLVLLVTSRGWVSGEPGAPALDAALSRRGLDSRWVCWDDASVDWAAADLVAVRSPWDYMSRPEEFLAWAREVERRTPVLNGADVFAWNLDKVYLTALGDVPVVPTRSAETLDDLRDAVREFGRSVVKPRVGAGGAGVLVVDDPDDPRLGRDVAPEFPEFAVATGPWVVQPLVESVRTEGETSVFVLGGRAVSQVDKVPAGEEIRVHEHFGGRSTPVPLRDEAASLAVAGMAEAGRLLGAPLDYGRVDAMRLADGTLVVSELEVTEPGLYLDVLPANAEPFADLVVARLG